MITKTIEVTNEEGLHTRPANSFVKTVREFESEIRLARGDVEVPGKSLLKIMKLGIVKGDEVRLICDGPDEEDALAKLTSLLQPKEASS
jgi:phosphotransferase system HPr (HPr) family protein